MGGLVNASHTLINTPTLGRQLRDVLVPGFPLFLLSLTFVAVVTDYVDALKREDCGQGWVKCTLSRFSPSLYAITCVKCN